MRDLVGRYVVLQAAGVAQKTLQHAGSPRSPLSHTAGTLRARRRDRRTKGLHLSLGCAAWPMCSITHVSILMNLSRMAGEVRLVEGLVSGMVQGAECNPVEGFFLGAVTNAPLGRFTRITPTS